MVLPVADRTAALKAIRESGKAVGKTKLYYKGYTDDFEVFQIDLDLLVFNRHNGRIESEMLTWQFEHDLGPREYTPEIHNRIADFLWKSNVERNKHTLADLETKQQQRPGIVSLDGVIIDGNRRAMLLGKIRPKRLFEAVILPDDYYADEKAIVRLETEFQIGEDSKLDYGALEKYLSRLHDQRLGRDHDFTNKAGVVHSEVMQPEGTPERWQDRQTLWNEVEGVEKRKDAQLAREVEFAIPRELDQAQGVALARDFVQREFVDRGMVADLNVHWDMGEDGEPKPHAHVMLSMREAGPEGFGAKVRDWNRTELLADWRAAWAEHVNARLAELDIDAWVDHRSFKDQGIVLEPQNKIGPAASGRSERGEAAERLAEHHEIARRNGELITAHPSVALDAITRQQSTFTDRDLMRFAHRHTDDAEQFRRAMSAIRASPELVALGRDAHGEERFSTRDMIATEKRLERTGDTLADRRGHSIGRDTRDHAVERAAKSGLALGDEQRAALRHVTGRTDLAMVVGYAGSGKSAMLGVAREAWEAEGYQVRGAALSGIAAESLEGGSGIGSRTIASLEHAWTCKVVVGGASDRKP